MFWRLFFVFCFSVASERATQIMTPSLWKIEKHNFRGGPFLVDAIFAPLDTMIQLPQIRRTF